jgi:uncharacterized protein (TIGR00730 family)
MCVVSPKPIPWKKHSSRSFATSTICEVMNCINSVCVFCGSRAGADPAFAAVAEQLGRTLAERGVRLIYGGGSIGLMGIVMQAVLDNGGAVTGIIPEFLMRREVGNPALTELIVVDSMHERKRRMFELADGFAVLPGGLGTLDEAVEVITWQQLGLHGKPIAFLRVGDFWTPFETLIEHVIAQGFADEAIRTLFSVSNDPQSLLAALEEHAARQRDTSSQRL